MRKVTYKCNLCQEEKQFTELYTVYFSSLVNEYTLIKTNPNDMYDKQICKSCVDMIQNIKITIKS